MNKIIFIGVFNLLANICSAQVASGDTKDIQHPKNEFSFLLGLNIPVGAFSSTFISPTLSSSASKSVISNQWKESIENGTGAMPGFEIEFNRSRFYGQKNLPHLFGIKVTYLSFSSIPFKWGSSGARQYVYDDANYKNLKFLSFKIGPVLSISVDDLALQFYDQVAFLYGWGGLWRTESDYTETQDNITIYIHDQSSFKFRNGIGYRNQIGWSLTINNFMFDAGFAFGMVSFKNSQFTRSATAGAYGYGVYGYADVVASPKISTNVIFISAGYKFSK